MKIKIILLTVVFLIALFLRVYKISDIPNGFNQDESAIGYNAYSLLQTGKDEHAKAYPFYFKSFGDQKLPVYIYLTAFSEQVFGFNELAVRFPSALLGSLTVVMVIFLLWIMTSNARLALLTGFLLAINPWHLFFSRAAFEDNAGLTFAVFGTLFFILGIKYKKLFYFFLSIAGFALSVYSYNVTRLLAPLILGGLIWFNWKILKQFSKSSLVSIGIFFIVLLLPFFITILSPAGASSANGALITSTDILAKSVEMRSYLVGNADIIGTIFFNKYLFFVWQYFQNIIGSLSTSFFFITGSGHGSQGIGNMGTFYLFEFPLMLIGLITILKSRVKSLYFFLFWAVVSLLVLSLSKEVPHATRGYFLVLPVEVFSAFGLLMLWKKIQNIKLSALKFFILLFLVAFCVYNIVFYFSSYYFRFPVAFAKGWRQQDKALALYLKDHEKEYAKIIIDNKAGFIYTSLLFFTSYPPADFQATQKRAEDDSEGFSHVISFGKYEWKDIDWKKDLRNEKTLIVTGSNNPSVNVGILKTFSYPIIPIVLSVKEQLLQYPSQEQAYILIETK